MRDVLESHFVSPAALAILLRTPFTAEDYEAFISERQHTLLEAIENLCGLIFRPSYTNWTSGWRSSSWRCARELSRYWAMMWVASRRTYGGITGPMQWAHNQ